MRRRVVPDDWHRKQIEQKGRQCAALFHSEIARKHTSISAFVTGGAR